VAAGGRRWNNCVQKSYLDVHSIVGSFVSSARPFASECSQIRDALEHGSGSNEALRRDQEEDMSRSGQHAEKHLVGRIGWMRAAVLGANDGIISTASLIVGVAAAAAAANQNAVLIAGIAGLVAGAMAMAAGEYVSVSSQSDTERADLALE